MPAKTIKMTKRQLIKEHKRLTKLLNDTIMMLDTLKTVHESQPFLTKIQRSKFIKIYDRLKNEYEDQINELADYKQR